MRIRLSEPGAANSVTVVSIPYSFDRIEFWAESGSGDMISRHYSDPLFWLYNTLIVFMGRYSLFSPGRHSDCSNSLKFQMLTLQGGNVASL